MQVQTKQKQKRKQGSLRGEREVPPRKFHPQTLKILEIMMIFEF